MTLKIFAVGLPKSGTSSLQDALLRSDVSSLHWYMRRVDKYAGSCIYQRWFARQNLMADFPGVTSVTQPDLLTMGTSFWPQMDPALLREVARQNPGVSFILNYRDPVKIADSMERWGNFMERLYTMGAPGMPPRMARTPKHVRRWIEDHYSNIRAQFEGSGAFLEYHIEDPEAPEKICRQTGIEIRWWGHSNKNRPDRRVGVVR